MQNPEKPDYPYDAFLNKAQQEIAPKIEALLIGLTVKEAQELLHFVRKAVEHTKIS